MKKFLFLLAAVAAFAFAGCEEEKGNEIDSAYIAGSWNNDGQKYFQFNEDGSGQMIADISDETAYVDIRWTLSGKILTVIASDLTEDDGPSGTFVYSVVTLTNTKLVLKFPAECEPVFMQFTRG